MASEKVFAPVGRIMNSCIASPLPACEPPLMMLKAGTGSTSFLLPAKSAMCLYSGMSFSAAPALHTAIDTAKIALAPNLPLLGVPSSSRILASIAAWSVGSMPARAGARMSLMLLTALYTLLPRYLLLSPSRSSTASCTPVDAPLGTAARYTPRLVVTSASTVGLPRESMIWRPTTDKMAAGACLSSSLARKGSGSSGCASTHALIAFSILSDRPCFLRYAMTLSGTAAAGTVEARRRRPAVARGATEASGNGCGRSNAAATLVDLRDGRRCARRATRDAVVLGSAACESSAQRGARGLCNKVSSLAKVGP
mmetsp:Transcript_32190/g.96113  ORF Transcript_32190/g.96113 Transcript_32190/m.96113 type:complete len:311 (-) Transcript_32190:46-978(-)